ncbi:MAG: imidazole glycerol phosphate synthase subunit HisH [Candidatus Omnitrophica bacterium]|nr:imidazole glycerol phosphate synthase subunit HisH [Candidatus Omnitrophota bacterium]
MIAVVDYGMGNLRSVEKALQVCGARTKVTSDPKDLRRAGKIVFPGVGSFGEAMKELKQFKLVQPIKDAIAEGKPFLGLCLGLQLLFEKSAEAPGIKGLCVLRGESKRFKARGLKVPHMGWNTIVRRTAYGVQRSNILRGVPDDSYMYFVHSYYAVPKDKRVILTTTDYGMNFASGIHKDNIYAFQFHPEKSQGLGLKILENFVGLR